MLIENTINKKRLTIKDVAALAGVSKAAISGVLNNKSRVGKVTEKKILDIIKQHNYVPQDSARALSTKRTYQIGFLVSSRVTLGLANNTFSTYLAGVDNCCQQRGYRMMASSCDMTKVENFLFIDHLRQRCVDGLILTGVFNSKIIDELYSLKIPTIFIGGNDCEELLCLRCDMHLTYLKMLEYLIKNEHNKIFFASSLDYIRQVFKKATIEFQTNHPKEVIEFQYGQIGFGEDEFDNGKSYAQQWLKLAEIDRYTTFISNDQACCGFLSEITKYNIKCPEKISIFSAVDSTLTQVNAIPVSAPKSSFLKQGELATNLLIDLLEGKATSRQIKNILNKEYKAHDLIIRATTGKAFKYNKEKWEVLNFY